MLFNALILLFYIFISNPPVIILMPFANLKLLWEKAITCSWVIINLETKWEEEECMDEMKFLLSPFGTHS